MMLFNFALKIKFKLIAQRRGEMFTCIACTKQMADGGEEVEGGARGSGTPSTKEAVKSLTSQVHFLFIY